MEIETYTGLISRLNGLTITRWLMRPGMGYRERDKWWAEGQRNIAHNGIDLLWYEGGQIDLKTLIPSPEDGEVISIIKDFIGESIFIRHCDGTVTALGHLSPRCAVGQKVTRGEAIATLAPSASVPPHLHISRLRLPEGYGPITWRGLEAGAEWLDPSHLL